MSQGTRVIISAMCLVAVLFLSSVMVLVNTHNQCVGFEEGLKAQYEQNKNSYDSMFKKIVETAGVTKQYAKDLRALYDVTMQGRVGGSQELVRAIQEANPSLDGSLYVQIQRVIESGRNDFASNQKSLLDRKKEYAKYLRAFPNNVFTGFLGFPKLDLDKYAIVASERTQEAFQSKVDAPINPFES